MRWGTLLCAHVLQVVGGAQEGLQVVTKGGALGPPDAFVESVRELKSNFDLGPGVGRSVTRLIFAMQPAVRVCVCPMCAMRPSVTTRKCA